MEDNIEIWKPVVGYEDIYEVSNLGRVKRISGYIKARGNSISYHKGGILKPITCKKGYIKYCLVKDGKPKRYFAHRIVAEAFISKPHNKPQVDHINTIKDDNRVENLRWVTAGENQHNNITYNKIINNSLNNNPFKGKHHTTKTKEMFSYNNSKEILQITTDNIIIGVWENMKVASQHFGGHPTNICNVLKGKNKTAFGFKWLYSKDYFITRPHHLVFAQNLVETLQV